MIWNHPTGVGRTLDGERVIHFGLAGSGDIIGVWRRLITEDMIGTAIGQALAIETKRSKGGVWQLQQQQFKAAFEDRGGLYILAPSVDAVRRKLG
jgi:hypothetical protein